MDLENFTKEEKLIFHKKLEIRETAFKFAEEYHRNTSGDKLRFDTFQHMVEIYEDGPLKDKLVIMAGTQIGKTDCLVIYCLAAAYHGLNILYVLPTKKFKDNYVQEKILRPISFSPEYKEIKKKGVADSIDQMQFGKGIIKFVSANVPADVRASFSADIIVMEEIDEFDKKAVDSIPAAMSRVSGSKYQFLRIISNPQSNRIADWYERSDKRVRKFPCDTCGEFSEIDWFKSVVLEEFDKETGDLVKVSLRDEEWFKGCNREIHIKCPCEGCNGNLDRLSEDAYWEATAVSEEGITGYLMPSTISPNVKISLLWQEYQRALDNPSEMSVFYFSRLGLPNNHEGHRISNVTFQKCADENLFEINGFEAYLYNDIEEIKEKMDIKEPYCVMGTDVKSDSLDVSIALVEGKKQRLMYVAKLDPIEMYDYYMDLFTRYNITHGVIDAVPETVLAKAIQNEAPCEFWRCHFGNSKGGHKDAKEDWDEMLYETNRSAELSLSYQKYRQRRIILPANFEELIGGIWVQEMQVLTRQMKEMPNGKAVIQWVSKSGAKVDDHARMADAYRNIAYKFSQEETLTADSIYLG